MIGARTEHRERYALAKMGACAVGIALLYEAIKFGSGQSGLFVHLDLPEEWTADFGRESIAPTDSTTSLESLPRADQERQIAATPIPKEAGEPIIESVPTHETEPQILTSDSVVETELPPSVEEDIDKYFSILGDRKYVIAIGMQPHGVQKLETLLQYGDKLTSSGLNGSQLSKITASGEWDNKISYLAEHSHAVKQMVDNKKMSYLIEILRSKSWREEANGFLGVVPSWTE